EKQLIFLLKLSWKRINWERVIKSTLKIVSYGLGISTLGAAIFVIASLWLGSSLQEVFTKLVRYIEIVGILSLLTGIITAGKETYNRVIAPFDLRIGQYFQEP